MRHSLAALAFCGMLTAAEHRGLVRFAGLPVPGATVTASKGEKRFTAVTDPQGIYTFGDLADGNWNLKVEMLCFAPVEREIAVAPNAPSPEWELKLLPFEEIKASAPPPPPPGAAETAPAAAPATANAAAGATTPAKTETAAAAPPPAKPSRKSPKLPKGVPPPQAANTAGGFQRAEANASGDGAKAADSNGNGNGNGSDTNPAEMAASGKAASDGYLINGSVNNGANTPFAQSAAFGNNRRGARSLYNGGIGMMFDNAFWDARSYSITGQDMPKPDYSHLQGTANFGGPIKIPHLVPRNGPNLIVNYQWTRNRNANTQSSKVPTTAERTGDFSQSLNASGQAVKIFDPYTGTPFAGNVIPQNRISPQALALLSFYPLPDFTSPHYNYQTALVGSTHSDAMQARLNKSIGRKNNVNGSFGLMSTRSDSTNLFGFLDTSRVLGYQLTANWMRRFSMRTFLTLGYQFSRQTSRAVPFFAGRLNVAAAAGISGTNQEPAYWGPPQLSFSSGVAGLYDTASNRQRAQTHAVSPSLFWAHGSHNLTIGGDFRRQQVNPVSQSDPRGTFSFTGAAAGSDLAGFLLGVPDTSSIAYGNADKYYRSSSYDAYVTDDWRVSPSLTLNVGMRWEYGAPIIEKYGRLVNLDISPGFAAIAPVVAGNPVGTLTGRRYPDSLVEPEKTGFEPRLGLSWRPLLASSMVIRGGYGIYRDTSVYLPIAMRMAQQSPLSKSLSLNNAQTPLTLANGFYLAPNVDTNTFAVDPDFRAGYSQNWQLSMQRDLPGSLVMTATYLGIKGTRAQQQFLPHTYPAGATALCPACPNGYQYLASNGNSTRESGQFQLRRRLHSGFTASLTYTWSISIDDAALGGSGGTGGRGASATVIAQNWLDLSGERGVSPFDQRHLLNVQMQYTTGMGLHGGTLLDGWRGRLVKDWTFVTTINAGTGLPLTPIYGVATTGTSVTNSIRPDYTGAPLYDAPPGLFLNPAAVTAPQAGHWGNAGRNSIEGPRQFNLNASMSRTFRFTDRLNADFRMDATNALNHVTYPSWNVVASSSQFGLPSTANPMRSLQATMRLRF